MILPNLPASKGANWMKKTAVAWLLTACFAAGSLWASGAPGRDDDKGGARVAQLDEQLANMVEKDKNNCDQMAADVNKFVDQYAAEMRSLKEQGSHKTPQQRAVFEKKYQPRVRAAMAKMQAGVAPCQANPKVTAALSRLGH
jgi:hypothetical protein